MKAMILGEGTTIEDMTDQDRCPDCEWIELTTYGQPEPEYIRGKECKEHRPSIAARIPKRPKPRPSVGIELWIRTAHELDNIDRRTGLAYQPGWRPLVNYRHRILINQFAPDTSAKVRY